MLIAGSVALSACSSGGAPSGASSGGKTTITFWNSFTSDDRPAVEALVAKFNATSKDAKIDMTIMPADVLGQKLLPGYASKTGPTITTLDASQLPEYATKGVFAPVDDAYGKGGLTASALPGASLKATTWQGKQYGVPFAATGTMLYYNKKLFAAAGIANPPATMDELVADAEKLTKYVPGQQDKSRFGFLISDHAGPATWAVLLENEGGSIVSADGKKSTFGDAGTIKAMNYWADLIINKHITPAGLAGTDTDTLFGAGRGAMYINGPWASSGFKKAGIDFAVAPIPAGPAAQTSTAISVNMHLNATATAAQKKAAYEFFDFWNSPASQTYWAIHSAYPPNLASVPESAVAANPTSAAFTKAVGEKFYLAGITQASQIDTNVVIPTIQQITAGKGSADQLLPQASKQIDALLSQ